ncbi:MAG TPA: sterol desaturase family protein [Parvibaculum sp.]|jgi:sterol desaturase/sphingolipid hydroxylase (fatty acid hydroxylase superfamily)
MSAFLLGHEPLIRLAGFAGVFAVMALWEMAAPRRVLARGRRRWLANLSLSATGALLLRLALPALAVGTAIWAQDAHIGFFNRLEVPPIPATLLSIVALDLLIYGQHVAFHKVGIFWRLHKVHHADPDIDVTTGVRFHPLEILVSMIVKMAAVAALGVPPVAVLLFEVLLNGTSMFNHGNIRLSETADRALRRFIVTPDMHRVHHSVERDEHDSNFGFNLSLWDRLFGTYRAAPRDGQGMRIGLADYADIKPTQFLWSLGLPFFKLKETAS